jgi:hypothetical protein
LTSQASNPGPQGNQQQLYFSEAETNSSSGVSEGDMPRQQHRATQTDLMSGRMSRINFLLFRHCKVVAFSFVWILVWRKFIQHFCHFGG